MPDKFKSRKFLATVGVFVVITGLLLTGFLTGDQYVSLVQFILPAFVFAQAYQDVKTKRLTAIRKKTQRPPRAEEY